MAVGGLRRLGLRYSLEATYTVGSMYYTITYIERVAYFKTHIHVFVTAPVTAPGSE